MATNKLPVRQHLATKVILSFLFVQMLGIEVINVTETWLWTGL